MIRSIRTVLAIAVIGAGSLSLGGCGAIESFTGRPVTPANVMAVALETCSFLPEFTTITDLVVANPGVTTAEKIAKIICDAVGPKAAPGAMRVAKAGVVVVQGRFVD